MYRQAGHLASAVQWQGAVQSFIGLSKVSDQNPMLGLSVAHSAGIVPFSNLVAYGKPFIPALHSLDLDTAKEDARVISSGNTLEFNGNWYVDPNGIEDKSLMVYKFNFNHQFEGVRFGDQIIFSFQACGLVPDGLLYHSRSFEYHPTVAYPSLEVKGIYSIDTLPSKVVILKYLGSFLIPSNSLTRLPMHLALSVVYKDLLNVFGSGQQWWLNFSMSYQIQKIISGMRFTSTSIESELCSRHVVQEEIDYSECFHNLFYEYPSCCFAPTWEFV